jgi:hypothetical protein
MLNFSQIGASGTPADPILLDLPCYDMSTTSWDYLTFTHQRAQEHRSDGTKVSRIMYNIPGYTVVAHPGDSLRDVVQRAVYLRRLQHSRTHRWRHWLTEGHLDGRWSPFRLVDWLVELFTKSQ